MTPLGELLAELGAALAERADVELEPELDAPHAPEHERTTS